MATSANRKSRNNLDRYLCDLYERDIRFCISKDEVEQIQNAVETFVFKIVDEIAKSEPKLSVNTKDLLKVGSYYEGTKICYPDEFDFIATFKSIYSNPMNSRYEEGKEVKEVKKQLERYQWYLNRAVSELESQNDTSIDLQSGKLVLDTSPERHGPASKLCLYYVTDGGRDVKGIHADITAAVKVKGAPEDMLEVGMANDQLRGMVRNHGNHLLIFNYEQDLPYIETFTEIEMAYMSNVMSEHHRRVFKILKYLINGKYTTEESKGHVFSSYSLKTMMFHHNFECTEKCAVSTCILNVLRNIHKTLQEAVLAVAHHAMKRPIKIWYNIFTGRSFSKKIGTEVQKCKRFLELLIDDLESSIEQLPEYCFEKCHVKSLIEYF